MNTPDEIKLLKIRIANLEKALLTYDAVTFDTYPPAIQEALTNVGGAFCEAISSFGETDLSDPTFTHRTGEQT